MGAFFVSLNSLLAGKFKCPLKAFVGRDTQSDKVAAWLFNQECLADTWDSLGLLVASNTLVRNRIKDWDNPGLLVCQTLNANCTCYGLGL